MFLQVHLLLPAALRQHEVAQREARQDQGRVRIHLSPSHLSGNSQPQAVQPLVR